MRTIRIRPGDSGKRGDGSFARAFTLVEIMFSVLILGILLGLTIVTVRHVVSSTKGTVDRQTVLTIRAGATQFKQQFGFPVPMVRENDPDNDGPTHPSFAVVEATSAAAGAPVRVSVHKPTDRDYVDDLAGEELDRNGGGISTVDNPLKDYRFSERSLPIYLVGQLEVDLYPTHPGITIDGVIGPGFCKPKVDGSFETGWVDPATGKARTFSARTGQTFQPFVNTSSAPKLAILDPADAKKVALADRGGVAIRYYEWLPDDNINVNNVPDLNKLNIPWMVGRLPTAIPGFNPPEDRDLQRNTTLKMARFAIVAAGPDGLFGDETGAGLEKILINAGFAANDSIPADIVKARMQAEQDNIVEVGQ